ncbi:3-oxoadipate enol-lactonase [Herbaspirillum sp. RTI4]|uniref:3-oxoadipate enol-lactonase n=1 Tax=Herbaspirillum sp. RTI4 TaxID=3048640 RepID=UPI002AB58719|nr:3-oxoadipate enol-lactonase [Herbaspirillum sp. RTI4]MDY7577196.1 3-oxoadipate enol-lactonase [Herbaspirillum sp. RTI4]MEA9980486.1 3-oxoadipate enol-lactonase [Herbaspirillum sp. RTI4]
MSTLLLNGETVSYSLHGPAGAPVLLFANSLGTDYSLWDYQASRLLSQYRVLRYDARGHGGSSVSTTFVTLAQLGGDVIGLLDALEVEQVHFCGISMGGMIGLWLAIHAGERLNTLVVANSAARIGTAEGWRTRAELTATGMDAIADGAASRWFTADFIARSPELVQRYVEGLRKCSPAGYASGCQALAEADLRDAISTIKTPTLIIAGSHDPVTTVDDALFMQSNIPDAVLEQLDASHLSNLEAPVEFTHLLQEFLR